MLISRGRRHSTNLKEALMIGTPRKTSLTGEPTIKTTTISPSRTNLRKCSTRKSHTLTMDLIREATQATTMETRTILKTKMTMAMRRHRTSSESASSLEAPWDRVERTTILVVVPIAICTTRSIRVPIGASLTKAGITEARRQATSTCPPNSRCLATRRSDSATST